MATPPDKLLDEHQDEGDNDGAPIREAFVQSLSQREVARLSAKVGGISPKLPLEGEAAPAPVDAPPASAAHGAGGLRYTLLARARPKKVRPDPQEGILLRFRAWTTDGLIASSRTFGKEDVAAYPPGAIPAPWAGAIAELGVGDAGLFWVPAHESAGQPLPAQLLRLEIVDTYVPKH